MILFVLVVFLIAISSSIWCAEAARPAPDCSEFDREGLLAAYPSMYDKARAKMATWMARLPSGPSPKGPGH